MSKYFFGMKHIDEEDKQFVRKCCTELLRESKTDFLEQRLSPERADLNFKFVTSVATHEFMDEIGFGCQDSSSGYESSSGYDSSSEGNLTLS